MTTIVTTDDAGTLVLPADVLGAARPNTPYVVEADGEELSVRPQNGHALNGHAADADAGDADDAHPETLSPDEWLQQWKALAAEIGAVWPAGVSAADVISEMRNARGQGYAVDN